VPDEAKTKGSGRFVLRRTGVRLLGFIGFWMFVWLLQWWLAPTWLVGSKAGTQTLLQALPGSVVALLALIFASLYVLGQQAANVYGSRAVAVLIIDPRVFQLVARALILAIVPLLLGGQVPDEGSPAHAVTAATSTVVLAVSMLVLSAANGLLALLGIYMAPRMFVLRTVEDVEPLMRAGELGLVVFRVSALGEMLRAALRRGEGVAVGASLEGMRRIQDAYNAVARTEPDIRRYGYDADSPERTEGWLGYELSGSLARAGDEALRTMAVEQDIEAIASTLEAATLRAIQEKQTAEPLALIEALIRLGVSSHQVGQQAVNLWPQSVPSLARVEAEAEAQDVDEVAAAALAGWALVCSYVATHFEIPHPSFELSLPEFGPSPPWYAARDIIESDGFQQIWSNKLERGIAVPLEVLRVTARRLGVDLDDWPKLPDEETDGEENAFAVTGR
jgi:hypothetical protein